MPKQTDVQFINGKSINKSSIKTNALFSLKNKLITVFLLLIVIVIGMISSIIFVEMKSNLTKQFSDTTSKQTEQVDNGMDMYFNSIKENVKYLAKDNSIKKADSTLNSYVNIEGDKGKIDMDPSKGSGLEQQIYYIYSNFGSTHPSVAYVYLATKNGAYIQWPKSSIKSNFDPRLKSWYQKAMDNSGDAVRDSSSISSNDKDIVVSTVATVKDDNGDIIGVQGIDVSVEGLAKVVKNIKLGKTGYVILTEEDGTIIANPKNAQNTFKNINDLKLIKSKDISKVKSGNFETRIGNNDYMINIYTSPKTGLKYVSLVQKSELMGSVYDMEIFIFILFIISIILSGTVAVIFSNSFTKPIIEAINYIKGMSKGNFTHLISDKILNRSDEIGVLGKALKTMQISMKEVISETKESSAMLYNSAKTLNMAVEQSGEAANSVALATQEILNASEIQVSDAEKGEKEIDELAQNIDEVSKRRKKMNNILESTSNLSNSGISIVGELIYKSEARKIATDNVNKVIRAMDKMSDEIEVVVGTISGIANQTKLLALNAEIEAARAGEMGKGFAVVANEVRKLAEESAKSSTEIKTLIENIQFMSKAAVKSMDESQKSSKEQEAAVAETEKIFINIAEFIKNLREKSDDIKACSKIMLEKKEEIVGVVQDISISSKQTAGSISNVSASMQEQLASTEQIEACSSELKVLAERLKGSVDKFVVE
ncbi:MAG: methyl-accepting chemotaxis protein [Bacillota bacterium]|nr:methyl-accepting chemotaxis protein [Bacillota bacterium]